LPSASLAITLGVEHLVIEVVALAGALAHAGEHRDAAVAPWRCC